VNNPVDVLFYIREIQRELVRFVTEETGQEVGAVRSFDDLFAVWKLLVVVAEIPDPERIVNFMEDT
jgi:hypothetical protein